MNLVLFNHADSSQSKCPKHHSFLSPPPAPPHTPMKIKSCSILVTHFLMEAGGYVVMCHFYLLLKHNRQQNRKCSSKKIRTCSVTNGTNTILTSLRKMKQQKELNGSINWERRKGCCATMADTHHIPLTGFLECIHNPPYTYFFPNT